MSTIPPFVVLALPRSRTAWLSSYLSYDPWICGYEELQHVHTLDDIAAWFSQPHIGTVETCAAPFWKLIPKDARVAVVRRPFNEVMDSLARQGIGGDTVAAMIRACDRKLDQIEHRVPGVLSVRFDDLEREDVCAAVFKHCLQLPHDPPWWRIWNAREVSGDLKRQVRYAHAHLPRFLKLAKVARHRILATMQRRPESLDGVTFQTEPFRTAYRDAERLLREHMTQIGEAPDYHMVTNLPLFQLLDDLGKLHVFTARSNGRMFSYLVSIIGPSLQSPDELVAEQTPFFADPSFPGLGMRTQRAAIADLKSKGVHRVLMRAGHRASGPRLGPMFERLGAERIGELYSLSLAHTAEA